MHHAIIGISNSMMITDLTSLTLAIHAGEGEFPSTAARFNNRDDLLLRRRRFLGFAACDSPIGDEETTGAVTICETTGAFAFLLLRHFRIIAMQRRRDFAVIVREFDGKFLKRMYLVF